MFEALIISALISAIAGGASTLFNTSNQWDMLDAQQQFNHDEAQMAREYSSEPERYNRMVGLGFNPDLVANSIMGNPSQSAGFAASSPAAPQVAGANPLANAFGSISDKVYDSVAEQARIDNLNSDTRFNNVQSDFIPLQFSEQKKLWQAQADKYVEEGKMSKELATLYKNQAVTVVPLAQSEIAANYSKCAEAFAAADLFWAQADIQDELGRLYESEISLNDATKALRWQEIKTSRSLQGLYEQETKTEEENTKIAFYNKIQEYYDTQFRQKLGGVPMSNDMMENIFFMGATPEGRAERQNFIDCYFEGCRILDDAQTEANSRNRGTKMFNRMVYGLSDAPGEFVGGLGFGLGMNGGRAAGVKAGAKAASAGAKAASKAASSSASKGQWKNLGRGVYAGRSGTWFQKPDGGRYFDFD